MCLRMQFILLIGVSFFTPLYGPVQPHMHRLVGATWGTFKLTMEWLQLLSSIHEVRRTEATSSKTHICWHWNRWTYQSCCVSGRWIWVSTQQARTDQGSQWKSTRCWHRCKASSQLRRHLDCFHSSPSCIRGPASGCHWHWHWPSCDACCQSTFWSTVYQINVGHGRVPRKVFSVCHPGSYCCFFVR